MPIETSLADMQWLTQAGDAGTNLARGAQVGSAIASSRYQQQRINLEKQQLAAELAQMPLKQTLMQQSTEMNALKLTEALEQRQLMISNETALREAYNLAGQALASGSPEDAESRVMEVISRTMGASRDVRFQTLLKDVKDSASAKLQLQVLRNSVGDERRRIEQERLDLEIQKQARLREQFEFQKRRWEASVPADKLALFREGAAQIRGDLTLLADPAKAEEKLKALAESLGIGQTKPLGTGPAPAVTNAPPFKIRVIKP